MGEVTIVGAGMMGSGIASIAALAMKRTILVDQDVKRAKVSVEKAADNIDQLSLNGLVTVEQAANAKPRLGFAESLEEGLENSELVIEAVTECLEVKQQLFARIDDLTDPSVLITSNTSGLRISDIAKFTKHPERTATTHFWFPAHLVPLVEIVMGEHTSEETATQLRAMLCRWGKTPVVVRQDLPGQLANRILQAIIREATYIVEAGIATPEDVDTAVKAGMAVRFPVWGPLEHIDAVGLDLAHSVQQTVLPFLSNRDQPAGILSRLCDDGDLGWKTGKGFYEWTAESKDAISERRDRFICEAVKLLKNLKERESQQSEVREDNATDKRVGG